MHRLFKFVVILALSLTATVAANAEGTVSIAGNFSDGAVNVQLATYTDGPAVVALIGMKGNGTSISFAFDTSEWPKLLKLWQEAREKSGDEYQTAGSLTEVGSTAACVITMAGGPAVRITIIDPRRGPLVYDVQPSDQASFESYLSQIGNAATTVN